VVPFFSHNAPYLGVICHRCLGECGLERLGDAKTVGLFAGLDRDSYVGGDKGGDNESAEHEGAEHESGEEEGGEERVVKKRVI